MYTKIPIEDKLIYSNSLYDVLLGQPEISEEFNGLCYKIFNREYGLIELETTVLMKALYSADDFERHVLMHVEEQKKQETVQ